jgi:hypothetical protein
LPFDLVNAPSQGRCFAALLVHGPRELLSSGSNAQAVPIAVIHMPVGMARNAPANFPHDWQSDGMVVCKCASAISTE